MTLINGSHLIIIYFLTLPSIPSYSSPCVLLGSLHKM